MQNAEYSEIWVNISPHPPHPSHLALSFFLPTSLPPSLPPLSQLLLCLLPICFEGWIITAALRFPSSFFKAPSGDGEGLPGPGLCTHARTKAHTHALSEANIDAHACRLVLACLKRGDQISSRKRLVAGSPYKNPLQAYMGPCTP